MARLNADQAMNIAVQHHQAGKLAEAEALYRNVLAQQPNHAEALHLLGVVVWQANQDHAAVELISRAISIAPFIAAYHSSMGNLLREMGKFDEAIAACRAAIVLDSQLATAHVNLGVLLLLRGEFTEGWPELEWRWGSPQFDSPRRAFAQPRWKGEALNGRTILLHAEQGMGDTIQFIRYAPMVAERGGRVLVACQPELLRLLQNAPGIDQVVAKTPLPPFDAHCPLMSLPMVFAADLKSIPAHTPYLKADAALITAWGARVNSAKRLKVGLAWAGNPTFSDDRNRSIRLLSRLAPLAGIENVSFYSLQKGQAGAQAANPPAGMELIDFTTELRDFADTAALMSHLDLVISSDTAVVHLAGAMGKPVWTILSFVPDWRWLLDRDDSPWYPTMRLFRQQRPGEWTQVIERVAREIAAQSSCGITASRIE